jgi:hypothetical protein
MNRLAPFLREPSRRDDFVNPLPQLLRHERPAFQTCVKRIALERCRVQVSDSPT